MNRLFLPMVMVALALVAGPAFAQTTSDPNGTGTTTAQPPPPATQPAPVTTSSYDDNEPLANEFILGGFIGSDFARSASSASVDFGANLDYLRNGAVGVEFLAGFAPRFNLAQLGTGNQADINNYMANFIAAAPVGFLHSFKPYLSLGVGAMTMSVNGNNGPAPTTTTSPTANSVSNAVNSVVAPNETRLAGDIGGGVMGFSGRVGLRADIRYFSTLGGNATITNNGLTQPSLLNDTKFWRGNVGVAVRW